MPLDPALAAALDRWRALSTARAVLADPPGDDDALLRWLAPAVSS